MKNLNKIDKKLLKDFRRILDTAYSMDMDAVIIDEFSCRSRNTTKDVVLIEPDYKKDYFGIPTLAVKRLVTLRARLSLLDDDCDVYYEEENRNNSIYISKLIFKKNKTAVEFRCVDPSVIDAKKNVLDPLCFTFSLTEETIKILGKISNAMDTKNATFSSKDTTVNIIISDNQGDLFAHEVSDKLEIIDASIKDQFASTIKLKTLLMLLRQERTTNSLTMNITKRGLFNIKVNNLNFYIFPEL